MKYAHIQNRPFMNYAHIQLHIQKSHIQNHPFMSYAHILLHIHKVHIQNHPFMNYAHILLHIDKVLIQNHPFMNYAHMLLHIHKVHIQNHPFTNYAHIQLTDARQKSREARTLSEPSINNYARSNNKKETRKPNSLARLQSLKQSTTHDQHSRECISLKP